MDPGIENLTSTTFFGRRLTRRQIADIQETVALLPALSRNELAKTVCEHLGWTTPKGDYRVSACLRTLESLEERGILTLPAKRNTASEQRRAIEHTERSDPGPEPASLARLSPPVRTSPALVRCRPRGAPPRLPAVRSSGQDAARPRCMGRMERGGPRPAAASCGLQQPLPDPALGPGRQPRLRALAMAVRQLADAWRPRHRPVLCETLVDPMRHDGASYRAANWEKISMTAGHRGGSWTKPPKEIFVIPIDRGFRTVLKGERRPPKRPANWPS